MALQDNYILGDTSQYAVVINVTEVPAGQPMKLVQDGRLEQYVGGSGMDLGAEFDYDGITETSKVIKFDLNGLAVFSTNPSVSSILQAIL